MSIEAATERVWSCAFCRRSDVKRSNEHVLGRWFQGRVESGPPFATFGADHETFDSNGETLRRKYALPNGPFDMPVREVCKECNEGWLNDLDTRVRGKIVKLAAGEFMKMQPADLRLLRIWFFKTALVTTLRSRTAPRLDELFEHLYERGDAPSEVGVQFALCDSFAPNAPGRHIFARIPVGEVDDWPHLHFVAFGLGKLFFMVAMPSRCGKPARHASIMLKYIRLSSRSGTWRFIEAASQRAMLTPTQLLTRDEAYAAGGEPRRILLDKGYDANGWKPDDGSTGIDLTMTYMLPPGWEPPENFDGRLPLEAVPVIPMDVDGLKPHESLPPQLWC